jgi:hypothetical protein
MVAFEGAFIPTLSAISPRIIVRIAMASDAEAKNDAQRTAWNFTWQSFNIHANRRFEIFKAYLTLLALIFAGYGASLQFQALWIGLLLSVYSLLISIIFYLLDVRTRGLIAGTLPFLTAEEKRLAQELNDDRIELFRNSDKLATKRIRLFRNSNRLVIKIRLGYSTLLNAFFAVNIVVSFIFAIVFICLISR